MGRLTAKFNPPVPVDDLLTCACPITVATDQKERVMSGYDRLVMAIGQAYLDTFHALTGHIHQQHNAPLYLNCYYTEDEGMVLEIAPCQPGANHSFLVSDINMGLEHDVEAFCYDISQCIDLNGEIAFDTTTFHPLRKMKVETPHRLIDILEALMALQGLQSLDNMIYVEDIKQGVLTPAFYATTADRIRGSILQQGHAFGDIWQTAMPFLPPRMFHSPAMALCNGYWNRTDKPACCVSFDMLRAWADKLVFGDLLTPVDGILKLQ